MMAADTIAAQALLAIILFFLANWIGTHSISSGYHSFTWFERVDEAPAFNFVFRVVTPLVFFVLAAAALYAIGLDAWVENFYFLLVYYFVFRWVFNVGVGRTRLLNWPLQFITATVTIASGYLLYVAIISRRESLLPSGESLSEELWILVIIYLYNVFNRLPVSTMGGKRRQRSYVSKAFRKMATAYGPLIREQTKDAAEEAFVYSVLIYEDLNRPALYRAVERYILYPLGQSKSLGPMQIQSEKPISDRESVTEGVTRLLSVFRKTREAEHAGPYGSNLRWAVSAAIRAAASAHNIRSDYSGEVHSIFGELVETRFPDAWPPEESPSE